MNAGPSYAIVTPARNERDNLERLAASVLGQTQRPQWWIIVDDGSDDGMDQVAQRLADEHPFILLERTGEGSDRLEEGRRQGRDLLAFRLGVNRLPAPVDVFVKVDADTSFDADYFATLMGRFAEAPQLGIAGGTCYELEDGVWERVKVNAAHPRGASRAYRWELLDDVMALEPTLGWDGVDEVLAELRGLPHRRDVDFGFRHHRRVGEREGRLRARLGPRPPGVVHGLSPELPHAPRAYRARTNPASMAMLYGYAAAAAGGDPRCAHPSVVDRVRDQQRLREVLRNRVPV